MREPNGCAGFTLLEAIIAIALLGIALVPIVSFLSLSANELAKAADSNDRSLIMETAIALMDPINVAQQPSGTAEVNDGISIAWDSKELVPAGEKPVSNSGLPAYRVGFYQVHVRLMRKYAGPWFDFDMRKVGYTSTVDTTGM